MKLPQNFTRERVAGSNARGRPANGWIIRIGSKACFITRYFVAKPGAVRERLETVLGLNAKPQPTQEELTTALARTSAARKRAFRNRIARGEDVTPPWAIPRTVRMVANEERFLAITQKLQRMGEYRR